MWDVSRVIPVGLPECQSGHDRGMVGSFNGFEKGSLSCGFADFAWIGVPKVDERLLFGVLDRSFHRFFDARDISPMFFFFYNL